MRYLLAALFLLFAAPAGATPDATELRAMVEARIAEAAGPGLLEVQSFRRMGEAPDPAGGARIAYFAARLRLTQDHDFGSWEGRNLQALAAALGAGSRAISGAQRGGNRAGDTLGVNGALRLRQEGDRWVPLGSAGRQDSTPAEFTGRGARAEQLLAAIGTALTAGGVAAGADATPVIEEELAAAWRNIEGRVARLRHGIPLAGGAPGSEYARLAEALARLPPLPGVPAIVALPSAGSVENLRLVAAGTALIGIAQADVAAMARRAEPGGAMPSLPGLRALAALYPEAVQVVVPAASTARRMSDLAGRPVGVGAEGSGARVTALAVLDAHGLDAATTLRVPLAPDAVAAALAQGRVAAYIGVSLVPAQAMLRLADALPLRLLPLEEGAMARIDGPEGVMIPFTIPAGTFPGQAQAVPTLATQAVLLGTEALTTAEVAALLGLLFRDPGITTMGGPAALLIRRETAFTGLPVPLHGGVETFRQRVGR